MAWNVSAGVQVTDTNSPSASSSAVATVATKWQRPRVVTINTNSLRISSNNDEQGTVLQNGTSSHT